MKKFYLLPVIAVFCSGTVLLNKTDSISYYDSTGIKKEFNPPSIEVIEVKPVDAGNNLYFLTCAARTAKEKPSAQLSASFKIKNKTGKPITLTNITYSYSNNGKNALKIMVLDIDDLTKKKVTIPTGGSFSWQNSRDYHEIDNAVLFESPFPSSISIRLSFEGYSDPFIITRTLKSYSNQEPGGAYSFPGKESDLRVDEYWYGYGGHGGGGQFYRMILKQLGGIKIKKNGQVHSPEKTVLKMNIILPMANQ